MQAGFNLINPGQGHLVRLGKASQVKPRKGLRAHLGLRSISPSIFAVWMYATPSGSAVANRNGAEELPILRNFAGGR